MIKKAFVLGLIVYASSASATTVTANVSSLGGTTWRYDYTISNDTLAVGIDEFTIYFDYTLFTNLTAVTDTPAGWDVLAIQPDPAIPDDGFYDALALAGGIAPGAAQGGFAITFDYLGSGTPGAQLFEVVDPQTFAVLDSGSTAVAVIPVPAALWLLLSGLAGLWSTRRLRRP